MLMMRRLAAALLSLSLSSAGAVELLRHPKRTAGGLHLPIFRQERDPSQQELVKRQSDSASSIGLGNFRDITYNVLVDMGGVAMPLVLDTGSSDLWAISDACTDPTCQNNLPRYPQANFKPSGVDAQLFYGDSTTGTHAFGEVGKDKVGLAGLTIQDQLFGSINQTNTTVVSTQSAGIFGLGFPVNSVIWNEMFLAQFHTAPSKRDTNLRMTKFPNLKGLFSRNNRDSDIIHEAAKREVDDTIVHEAAKRDTDLRMTRFPNLKGLLGGSRKRMLPAIQERRRSLDARSPPSLPLSSGTDYRFTRFPNLKGLLGSGSSSPSKRQTSGPSLSDLLGTFTSNGPLMSRLAQTSLVSPEFTVALQRSTVDPDSGNTGVLSLGELPDGVDNSSLTWVPIRGYTPDQGGIDSPNDIYPIAWEVPIDAVFLDGQKLADSKLSPGISVTALVDTGNSLIRGPADVVSDIMQRVTGSATGQTYPCTVPHTLSFVIGGKTFSIDPRDFFNPTTSAGTQCKPNVVQTDPPKDGFLYSWSLGDPFLKSVITSFYFGNLTHPSADPPRMGFVSTVPQDAPQKLQQVVQNVNANNGVYPTQIVSSPPSNPSALRLDLGSSAASSAPPAAAAPSGGVAGSNDSGSNNGVVTETVTGPSGQPTSGGQSGSGNNNAAVSANNMYGMVWSLMVAIAAALVIV